MMIAGLMAGLLAATPAPSAEAEALGLRLAQHGMLATMLPMLNAKDSAALVAAHPDLAPAEQARLRATAARVAEAGGAKLFAAIGHVYAAELSVADLEALVAFQEGPLAARYKAAEPAAIAGAMRALGGFDFKQAVWTHFCAHATGTKPKGCEAGAAR